MKISHLQEQDGAIRCVFCCHTFEVHGSVLRSPMRLMEFKESLAVSHVCGRSRRRTDSENRPRPADAAVQRFVLDAYFVGEMRRLMRAG